MNQRGQAILILILLISVGLSIGLSIVQKSLSDVSTASKVEQSSRAFSAAEAGVEKALSTTDDATCVNCQTFTDTSSSIKQITDSGLIPCVPGSTGSSPPCAQQADERQVALEYPPLAKEDTLHVWLADYTVTSSPPATFYTQPTLDIFWGDPQAQDKAALEITLIYYDSVQSKYLNRKWYLDQIPRPQSNGFERPDKGQVTCSGSYTPQGSTKLYQCKRTLGVSPDSTLPSTGMMLIRARLLYNSTSQPFAAGAVGACGSACSLPPQARKISSTGVSGETQRNIEIFQLYKVPPPFFDYAIFSAGQIAK